MAIMRDLSEAQLALQVQGVDANTFQLVRFRGTEGLCQLYRFEIDLVGPKDRSAWGDIVGKPTVLSINTDAGQCWFHGLVGRFEMTGEAMAASATNETHFRLELVPDVWLLTHRYDSRIFQNKSVKEIIAAVLVEAGIPSDRFDLARLQDASHPVREYCVQYRETDYNFICRLMEDEGIWWCFQQFEDRHVMVMGDKIADYSPIEGEPQLPYHPPAGMIATEEHVFRFRMAEAVRPGAVVLNDFSFENPALDLESKGDNARNAGLAFSDFPGAYTKQKRGAELATLRAQEFEASRICGVGQSSCKRLAPGKTFKLAEHPVQDFNKAYLVTRVMHEGKQAVVHTSTGANGRNRIVDSRVHQSLVATRTHENPVIRGLGEALLQLIVRLGAGDPTANRALTQWLYHGGQVARDLASTAAASGGNALEWLAIPNLISDVASSSIVDYDAPVYQCRFECIPADVRFVPPRITPWPVMRGTQTARVVGPESEEIQVDKYGRVKVQFHWDREGREADKAKLHGADSSCWIRVCQGMAGGAYGMMFIPRVGQEVVVDFLEGNPDSPIIVGRVYNADHMPPYPLPEEKTKSVIKTHSSKGGEGSNEIMFEDLKDGEKLLVHAMKDLHVRVRNDRVENVLNDLHLTVDKNKHEKVGEDRHLTVAGNLREEIKTDVSTAIAGKESKKVDGTQSLTVGSDVVHNLSSNFKCEAGGTILLKGMNVRVEAGMQLELVVGGNMIQINASGMYVYGKPLLNLNCATIPPVPPVAAQATTPEAPEAPAEADDVQFGKDTRYTGESRLLDKFEVKSLKGKQPEQPQEPKKLVWIEIVLVDEIDQPVPGERYELKLPDGKIRKGSLDANGRAHVEGIVPGTCQICFPNLDAEAWERI